MEFGFTSDQLAFRTEVRSFLKEEIPPGWCGRTFTFLNEDEWRVAREFDRKLAQRGWLTLPWPKEYGGQDLSPIDQLIFQEEMGYHRAPNGGAWGHGPQFVGPTIIHHGNDEQKARFLPPISSGEEIWCQGFTEPDAGSDLANLQTSAVRDGDDYVLNGEKHFVGQGHRAEWCVVAVRTDKNAPKHRGVSMLLMDMRSPGITVNRMPTMPKHGAQWQIIMDGVRVPKNLLVGEENRGFYQMMTTMDYERNRISHAAEAHRNVDDMWEWARERGSLRNPIVRHKLAERKIESKVAILLNYRIAWRYARGEVPNYEASIAKAYTEELKKRVAVTAMEVMGLLGQLSLEQPGAPMEGEMEDLYLATVAATIVGGSSEIQRNVIAQRGLGLPR
ncbi:MAG: acyl-CoA dehydrogenase family protein [Chloroflexi bacterium]|nr:acyl-CoA dehydrogenase family protein [Chloroflexota bacterium]